MDNQGAPWMRHTGRDSCPCSPTLPVQVQWRDGEVGEGRAGQFVWGHTHLAKAAYLDIIGWRFKPEWLLARNAQARAETLGSACESAVGNADAPERPDQ